MPAWVPMSPGDTLPRPAATPPNLGGDLGTRPRPSEPPVPSASMGFASISNKFNIAFSLHIILFCTRLFVTLAAPKLLPLGITQINFVLHSLIRNFVQN